jgi:hypothetical protein
MATETSRLGLGALIGRMFRVIPAAADSVSDQLWEMEDIVALIKAEKAKVVTKRVTCKKQIFA